MRVRDLDYYLPDMATFFVPQWVADYGLEGVSQYIAFCFIGTKQIGIGLNATINIPDRKQVLSRCKQAMADWIRGKNFPARWLKSYEK